MELCLKAVFRRHKTLYLLNQILINAQIRRPSFDVGHLLILLLDKAL